MRKEIFRRLCLMRNFKFGDDDTDDDESYDDEDEDWEDEEFDEEE